MAKLQIKYVRLLSLSIQQLFYRNGICRKYQIEPVFDLDIIPIAESTNLMKQKDMVFRHTNENGGIVILAHVQGKNSGGNDLLRFPAGPADKLTFGLILKNTDVLNQNDLPVELDNNQAYYFSNEVNDAAASRDGLHLTQDASGVKPDDLIKISPETYRYYSPTPVADGSAVVKHILTGRTVMPASLINEGGGANISFNLASLLSGKCQLLINGAVTDTFYYTGTVLAQPYFGIVEIMLSSLISDNYRVIEADRSLSPVRPAFLITFRNRKTVWRYTFQLYPNSPLYIELAALSPADKVDFLTKLNIVSNDAAVTFKQASATDATIMFESETALLLQENYFVSASVGTPLKLTLEKNIGAPGETTIKDNLPYPSTGLIHSATPSLIYSDIFITI